MKKISLDTLIKTENIQTLLVDACGVLYNKSDQVIGSDTTWNQLKASGKTLILVTNNTSRSPELICQSLIKMGFNISLDEIISSGDSLAIDPDANRLIQGKNVFNYGWESSGYYIEKAGGRVFDTLSDEIDTIAFMASSETIDRSLKQEILTFLKKKPNTQLICANPDQYIWNEPELYPVIGYYAKQIELESEKNLLWIGKPYSNFSTCVEKIIQSRFNIKLDQSCCFFDDNPLNVSRMVKDLGIKGALVSNTGLFQSKEYSKLADSSIPFEISQFTIS